MLEKEDLEAIKEAIIYSFRQAIMDTYFFDEIVFRKNINSLNI